MSSGSDDRRCDAPPSATCEESIGATDRLVTDAIRHVLGSSTPGRSVGDSPDFSPEACNVFTTKKAVASAAAATIPSGCALGLPTRTASIADIKVVSAPALSASEERPRGTSTLAFWLRQGNGSGKEERSGGASCSSDVPRVDDEYEIQRLRKSKLKRKAGASTGEDEHRSTEEQQQQGLAQQRVGQQGLGQQGREKEQAWQEGLEQGREQAGQLEQNIERRAEDERQEGVHEGREQTHSLRLQEELPTSPREAHTLLEQLGSERPEQKQQQQQRQRKQVQACLDFGQKDLLHTTCRVCGFVFAKGLKADEAAHDAHHRLFCGTITIQGWRNERVVHAVSESTRDARNACSTGAGAAETAAGRIVLIAHADCTAVQLAKMQEIAAVLERAMGVSPTWLLGGQWKAYLYIHGKQLVGCLVAEPISQARPAQASSNQPSARVCARVCGSREAPEQPAEQLFREAPEEEEQEDEMCAAVCGVRAIWLITFAFTSPMCFHLAHVLSPRPCAFTSPMCFHLAHVLSPRPCAFTSPMCFHLAHVLSPRPCAFTSPMCFHLAHVLSPRPCAFTSPMCFHLAHVLSPRPCAFTSPMCSHLAHVFSPRPCAFTSPMCFHLAHVLSPRPCALTSPMCSHLAHVLSPRPCALTSPMCSHLAHVLSPRPCALTSPMRSHFSHALHLTFTIISFGYTCSLSPLCLTISHCRLPHPLTPPSHCHAITPPPPKHLLCLCLHALPILPNHLSLRSLPPSHCLPSHPPHHSISFAYACTLSPTQIAFSQPTESGRAFAAALCRPKPFLVYK
ncbi:unnamed protein product [Closterium sp. Naga37s-1]|nr:unnamed protein product [Closterium sp. Naga37s-1]